MSALRVAVVAIILTLSLGGLAQANLLGDYFADGVNIRTGPWTSETSLGLGYVGHGECSFMDVQGESINGYSIWRYHQNLTTSVTGYSNGQYISDDSPPATC